ncbi:MAG: RadC family protein [Myxococcota bacterium]|nr:JAB domain-containing protein [Myxococcota bacterium]
MTNVDDLELHALLELITGDPAPLGCDSVRLSGMGIAELEAAGFTRVAATRVRGAFELARRSRLGKAPPAAMSSPEDAYACVAPLLDDPAHEHFVVVVLDVRNRPRRVVRVAMGSVDRCAVDPREVFAPAIREHGSAVLVAHNHPSGDPTPSFEDIALTQRLARAGEVLGLPILDHIIVGSGPFVRQSKHFVSLAELGILGGDRPKDDVGVKTDRAPTRARRSKKPQTLRLLRRR